MIIVTSSFSKSSVFKMVTVHTRTDGRLFQGRFRDGLVCTVGLTVEIKLHFRISPALCGCCLELPNFEMNTSNSLFTYHLSTVTTNVIQMYFYSSSR